MKSIVFDTNVLLDLFVFNDFRAIHLKEALLNKEIDALASPKIIEEFADVISRPLFCLDKLTQETTLAKWQSVARIIPDESLTAAPWQCQDPDDQVFINLAFTSRPCILISKDNEILKLAHKALRDTVLITDNYQI